MTHRRVLNTLVLLSAFLWLSACIGRTTPINVSSIKTVLQADGSGSNTFLLVMPKKTDCELLPLRPALEAIREQADTAVYFVGYQDYEYKGFKLTYEFDSPQQIPEQIEHVKRAIVQAVAATYPTPEPGQPPTPRLFGPASPPDPDEYGVFDPNELSLHIEPSVERLTGTVWKVIVRINPILLMSSSQSCGVPHITYELSMPGEITTDQVEEDAFPAYSLRYVHTTRTKNSIQWTIEPRSMGEIILEGVAGLTETEEGQVESLGEPFCDAIARLSKTEEGQAGLSKMLYGASARLSESSEGQVELLEKLFGEIAGLGESSEGQAELLEKLTGTIARLSETDEGHASEICATEEGQWLIFLLASGGPVYTLTATSTTPGSLFQILIRVVAPIVALVGSVVAVIAGILKLRQSMSTHPESTSGE